MRKKDGFSLVEVVLALGVIAFSVVAILGVVPIGLNTGHAAQDETRAAQIAQDILNSLAAQAPTNFSSAIQPPQIVELPSLPQYNVPLNRAGNFTYGLLGADNDGNLKANWSQGMPYQITLSTDSNPPGFDSGYACKVTVRVAWQPYSQNYRDYVRIISKY